MTRLLVRTGLLLSLAVPVVASATVIGHIRPDSAAEDRDAYFIELLNLALERTEASHGPYELRQAPVQMSQSRAFREMREGGYIDVVWSMATRDRERAFRPIRIPLLKGLLGVRVPVVLADDAERLAEVGSLEALRAYRAGQGHDWPDTRILEANGLPVTPAPGYQSLFRMLAKGRVDYVSRGIPEVWAERAVYEQHGLVVGDGPILAYVAPIYFFVAPGNEALAERLEAGLQRAITDGAFDSAFRRHPANRRAIEHMLGPHRPVIWLDNPTLHDETPTDRPALWYGPLFSRRPDIGTPDGS